jgi:hypothetical protein
VGNKTEQKRTVIKELLYSSSRHEDNELKERKANDPAWQAGNELRALL